MSRYGQLSRASQQRFLRRQETGRLARYPDDVVRKAIGWSNLLADSLSFAHSAYEGDAKPLPPEPRAPSDRGSGERIAEAPRRRDPHRDLDVLFVVEHSLTPEQRRSIALATCELSDERPVVSDLEMSVLRRADTTNFHQPLPFEVHYSAEWNDAIRGDRVDFTSSRTDPELAAYCTAVRARGVCLTGEPITDVFGPVPPRANRDAVLYDLAWILQEDRILERPIYGVLNCCRVLALEADGWGRVWSKEEGGEWALANLPEQHLRTVAQALVCYRSPEPVSPDERRTHGHDWDARALRAFRDYMEGRMPPALSLRSRSTG
jgi:Domain of unknown function (DUF4111)